MSYLDCGLNPLIYCSNQNFRDVGLALLWTKKKPVSEPVLTAVTINELWRDEFIQTPAQPVFASLLHLYGFICVSVWVRAILLFLLVLFCEARCVAFVDWHIHVKITTSNEI